MEGLSERIATMVWAFSSGDDRRIYVREMADQARVLEARAKEADSLRAKVTRLRTSLEAIAKNPQAWNVREIATDALSDDAPAATPRSKLCHHQDRPDCAGCPEDSTCEASGRGPKGGA